MIDKVKAVITPVENTVFSGEDIVSIVSATVSFPRNLNQPITPLIIPLEMPLIKALF
jgi:hypothetical protein